VSVRSPATTAKASAPPGSVATGDAPKHSQRVRDDAPPLLERVYEQAVLDAVIAGAASGDGRTALLVGPAGIGKTALLGDACARAAGRGMVVLIGRGGELERDFGFGVARQLLEPTVIGATPARRQRLLRGAARLAAQVLAGAEADGGGTDGAADAVLHGLHWLVANLSEEAPVLLAVDDAHWADPASLRFLIYLARRLDGVRASIALTVRTDEADTDHQLLRILEVEADPAIIRPQPLTIRGVSELVAHRLGSADDELCAACHRVSAGNPFILNALLDELCLEVNDGSPLDPATIGRLVPERVTAAVLLRVGRLGPAAVALAEAAAVLGEHAELVHAAAVAELRPAEASRATDSLTGAGVLGPSRPLRFQHPIVRTAIYDDIAAGVRSALHARAAAVLGAAVDSPEAVALHLMATDPLGDPAVIAGLRHGATAAMGRGAPEAAVRFLRRALREPLSGPERSDLAVQLGVAAWRAGEPDALDIMREGFDLAGDATTRGRAAAALAPALMFVGDVGAAVEIIEVALEDQDDGRHRARLEGLLLVAAISDLGAYRRLEGRLRAAQQLAAGNEVAPAALLSCLATRVALRGGTAAEVAGVAERALADGTLLGGAMAASPFPYPAAFWLALADRPRAAKAAMAEALSTTRDRGSRSATAFPLAYRALASLRLGELANAEADARAAIEAGSGIPHGSGVAVVVAVLVERGALDEARTLVVTEQCEDPDSNCFALLVLRESLAVLAMAEGDPAAALGHLRACERWEHEAGSATVVPVPWRSLAARAHLALGDQTAAQRLAAEEVDLARRFGAARQLGVALRAAGLVQRGERGLNLLAEAEEVLGHSEDQLERARALVEHGSALRRAGKRTQARDRLAAGMDLAHRCGASALVDWARDESRASGFRPRRLVLTGRGALTPSELRVAEIAATGRTNPEIAQALFVTLRTVEMHLSNAYRKLGISSRAELADALDPSTG
jgi:DNA-binding CsgD family transcriptional regulator